MSRWTKFQQRLLSGQSDQNIAFSDLAGYLTRLGFVERIKGDHHIFTKDGIAEIINLQPRQDASAKPYQVKQVRGLIIQHKLGENVAGETGEGDE